MNFSTMQAYSRNADPEINKWIKENAQLEY